MCLGVFYDVASLAIDVAIASVIRDDIEQDSAEAQRKRRLSPLRLCDLLFIRL